MQKTDIGMIPADWELRPLAELGEPKIGLTYSPADVRESGTLVLRSSNVQNDRLAFDDNVYVRSEIADGSLVEPGDILICVRNGSRALIGKCALIDESAKGMAFGAFMSVFRSPHSAFLFQQFRSDVIGRQIAEHLGATINQITNGSLKSFRVPFPPDDEERARIAQALSDIDDLIASLDALIAKKRDIKQGAMQELLSGKRRLPGFLGEWVEGQVGDLATCLRGVSYKGDFDLRETESANTRTLLRSNNIFESRLDFNNVQHVVCERVKDIQLLVKGDILLCMANGSKALVGKSALIDDDYPNLTFGAFMGCLRPRTELDGIFLNFLFQTNSYRVQIADVLSGSSINNLSPRQIEGLRFALPDFQERTAIATCLQSLEGEERAHQESRNKLTMLRQAMMQQLLTGRIRLP